MFEPTKLDNALKRVIFHHPKKGLVSRRLYHQKKCNVYFIWINRMKWQVMSYNSDDTVSIG